MAHVSNELRVAHHFPAGQKLFGIRPGAISQLARTVFGGTQNDLGYCVGFPAASDLAKHFCRLSPGASIERQVRRAQEIVAQETLVQERNGVCELEWRPCKGAEGRTLMRESCR